MPKDITTTNGRLSPEHTRILKDIFGEMRVVDAIENLRVFVNDVDISGAQRNNICECVYARACRRLYGSRAVIFFRTIAYVDLPNEEGIHEVNRFILGEYMKDRIFDFDKTGKAHPGGFLLGKPPKSKALNERREEGVKYRARNRKAIKEQKKRHLRKRRSVILGTLVPKDYTINKSVAGPIGYVRSGVGMAHFTTKKKA